MKPDRMARPTKGRRRARAREMPSPSDSPPRTPCTLDISRLTVALWRTDLSDPDAERLARTVAAEYDRIAERPEEIAGMSDTTTAAAQPRYMRPTYEPLVPGETKQEAARRRDRNGNSRRAANAYNMATCAKCGYARINVVHETDPANSIEGPEYYADILDELHEFVNA